MFPPKPGIVPSIDSPLILDPFILMLPSKFVIFPSIFPFFPLNWGPFMFKPGTAGTCISILSDIFPGIIPDILLFFGILLFVLFKYILSFTSPLNISFKVLGE